MRTELHPVVREGRFWNDEWVHDTAVWGWAYAQRPDHLAIRLADHCVAGRAASTLVLTTHRLAVVIETSLLGEPTPEPGDEPETGRGILGKALTLAKSFRSDEGGDDKASRSEAPVVATLWETPVNAIRGFRPLDKGRSVSVVEYLVIDFVDGSVLEFAAPHVSQDTQHIDKCFQRLSSPDPTAPPIQPR
ncbi:hypothetical protein [Streptoalloteichus hindustanus]|uniref:hypothetical protein n=1 Tax=Streptoalloteichus hindustanus TaxID=2017 RepID=UPI0009370713|nr:hypothetical protein [Streptoalloteichus hindustanus]